MKLYHSRDSRSLRPLWALEEMGLPYEWEDVKFPPRMFQKEFLGINALGTLPYFVDGATRMTESSAICHYLVERYQRFDFGLKPDHPEYGDYLNWLYHSDATLTFPQTIVLRYRHMEAPARKLPQAVEDYRGFFLGRLKLLNARIASREYLCDGRFTIADICIGYALYLGSIPLLDLADGYPPAVADYLQRLMARPAFQRAFVMGAPALNFD
jgi:glutathione S-transferase